MKSLDHIAFRVNSKNHKSVCDMFVSLFGYEISDEFEPEFSDGTTQSTICTVLSPKGVKRDTPRIIEHDGIAYQLSPDLFISSSSDPNSIVSKYVEQKSSIGSPHHFAYTVDSVDETMKIFHESGFEFLTKKPLVCDELTQTFTKPSELTGIIFEFLERRSGNFCKSSVGKLMESTKDCK